jgi:hypothetical protein
MKWNSIESELRSTLIPSLLQEAEEEYLAKKSHLKSEEGMKWRVGSRVYMRYYKCMDMY